MMVGRWMQTRSCAIIKLPEEERLEVFCDQMAQTLDQLWSFRAPGAGRRSRSALIGVRWAVVADPCKDGLPWMLVRAGLCQRAIIHVGSAKGVGMPIRA